MTLSPEEFAALVAEANLAPSVHNIQPTRWRLMPDGGILVLEDLSRRLLVGDPEGRDADVSHGAAIEGFAMAVAARGLGVDVQPADETASGDLRPVARLSLRAGGKPDPLRAFVPLRKTFRGAFSKTLSRSGLAAIEADDAIVVQDRDAIARLAALNDEASLRTFRYGQFRAELLSWMRLSRRDPRWATDGLNAEAMAMSPFEAFAAGLVLKAGVFEAFDRIGIAPALVAEASVVRSAEAIVLFHCPVGEAPLITGRRFYRLWLEITAAGRSVGPMAVLADDAQAHASIRIDVSLPADRRLITAFRIGVPPTSDTSAKPRLPADALVV